MPHRQDSLDHSGDSRRRPQMADIGLDRADQQGAVRIALASEDFRGGVQFDRVADDSARAVRFEVIDFGGSDAGANQGLSHGLFLRARARHRQTLAGAVLIDGGARNNGPDPVAVGLRVAQTLENDQAAAFAGHEAVGGCIEGPALARRRQHSRIGPQLLRAPGKHDMNAARQRQVGIVPLQSRDRLVNGDQG